MMMATNWIELVAGSLEQKKQYRQYKARIKALPPNYRTAIEALDRYLMYFGAVTKGDTLLEMLEDLLVLFEQSAEDGTTVRAIVGADPLEFMDTFLSNYAEGQWINKERRRLVDAIDSIADNEP
jgi:DNA-binding ferritin-like protein (Dps family)